MAMIAAHPKDCVLRTGMRRGPAYIPGKEIAMFKIAVVAFALIVSGFMLWVAHTNANFAQLPHATFIKRAA
jgi:Ni,Fe-hydrogenase I cytochrome b subunit